MTSSTCFPSMFEPNHPSFYQLISTYSPTPMQRGPMYQAYAELREWKLRIKRSPLVSSQACPLSNQVRKENSKPNNAANLLSRPVMEFERSRSSETSKGEEKRGGGLITMKKSYSSVKEMKELPPLNGIREEAKVVNAKMLRRCVVNFRRLAATRTTNLD